MKIRLLIITLLTMLTCQNIFAGQQTQIQARFVPAKVVPGEVTTYTITLQSAEQTRVRKITPPDWGNLEFISSTQSASTTKGTQNTRKAVWKFKLKAPQTGSYQLTGAMVDVSKGQGQNITSITVPATTLTVTGMFMRHLRALIMTGLFLFIIICAIPILKFINKKNRQARKNQKEHNQKKHLEQEIQQTRQDIELLFTKRAAMEIKEFFNSLCLRFDKYEEQITLIEEKPARTDTNLKEIIQILTKLREEINYMGQQVDPTQVEILHKKIKRYFQTRLEQTD